jgi:hypothetical protein
MYFSLAQRKVPKETSPGSLATPQAWLPSRGRFFRRGQKLVRLRRTQTICPLFPKKPPA